VNTNVRRWLVRVAGTVVLLAALTVGLATTTTAASAQPTPAPPGYTLEGNYPTYAECLFGGNAYYPDLFECLYDSPYWYLYVALPK
jgi:hypothetical protein